MKFTQNVQEFIADEIVSPLKTGRGLKRISPAKIQCNNQSLSVSKISRASLKHQSSRRRVASIIPGLVDPHTHLIFGGNRALEWEQRLKGASYQDIAKKGGGIAYTVKQTRGLDVDELVAKAERFLKKWMEQGCTTIEIKSGYGLDLESEQKILKAAQRLRSRTPISIYSTLMAAHKIPHGMSEAEYVDLIIERILPKLAGLCHFQDVFVEKGYFGEKHAIRLLRAGLQVGLAPKVHAHEFGRSGGVKVATAVKAVSADHLQYLSMADIAALKKAQVVPVVLSGTSFFLGAKKFAPAREMWDAGLPVALASDFNPGTNPGLNLSLVGTFAATHQRLSLEEVLQAQTKHAALALGLRDRGVLSPGMRADLVVLECSEFESMYYHYGSSWVKEVYANGKKI